MSRPGLSYEPPLFAWNVGSIVQEIADRAGVPYDRVETDILEGYVEGFVTTNKQSAASAIEQLAGIFLFDPANFDGVLHFVPRGGPSVRSISREDCVEDGGEAVETSRKDPITVPRVINLEYYDTDGGLTKDKQTSDRSQDGRSVSDSVTETTVIMRADDAARSVVISHKVSIEEQRGEISFSLPDSHLDLTVADVVTYEGARVRITDLELDDGVQNYTAVHDRQAAYESIIEGLPIDLPAAPPALIVDESRIEIIDTHILESADDSLTYYVAVSSVGTDWQGAVVEISKDGGANWIDDSGTRANSVMGTLSSSLAVGPVPYPDRVNTVSVTLLREDMTLLPATLTEMMNRANLAIIGDELVNFSEVEQVGPAEWVIGGFLRGRKGTPVTVHPAGTRFVLLNIGILDTVDAEPFELGRSLTFRITSVGSETPSQTKTIIYQGNSQRERMPAYLRAKRDGANLVVTWQGVGRTGGGASVGMGAHFAGYRVELGSTILDTPLMEVTIPYTPGTLSVRQLNAITGPGPAATVTV